MKRILYYLADNTNYISGLKIEMHYDGRIIVVPKWTIRGKIVLFLIKLFR